MASIDCGLHIVVVRHDAVDHFVALVELLGQIRADGHVRALDFVVDGLADVVQKAGPLGELHIRAQFGGHDARQVGDFDGMFEHVLAIAGAVAHAAQQLDQFVMDAVHIGFEHGLFARFADLVVHFAAGLFDHFFNAARMNAPIGDELFQARCERFRAARDRTRR